MDTFKKAKVILLPVIENPVVGQICRNSIEYFIWTKQHEILNVRSKLAEYRQVEVYNLHFVIDKEPSVGDYFYDPKIQITCIMANKNYNVEGCKKLIATLSSKLTPSPMPSPGFISKYVESLNSGKVIDEVMVQCILTWEGVPGYPKSFKDAKIEDARLVPLVDKGGYITIKKVKESWNKEEVKNIVRETLRATGKEIKAEMKNIQTCPYIEFSEDDLNKWLDKNL